MTTKKSKNRAKVFLIILAVLVLAAGILTPLVMFPVGDMYDTLSPVRLSVPKGALPDDGFLKAYGKHIIDKDGNAVNLRGINAGGYLIHEPWMSNIIFSDQLSMQAALRHRFGNSDTARLFDAYQSSWWSESDFDNIAAMGMNVIRLPFAYFNLAEPPYERYDFTLLENFVAECAKREIYVILDLHGAYGSQNGEHHSGDAGSVELFGNEENEAKTIDLWVQAAERFKDEPWVAGYDVLNEPEGETGLTNEVQWKFFKRAHDAIRAVDARHILFLNACWEAWDMPDPKKYGYENVVYEYHAYQRLRPDSLAVHKLFDFYKMAAVEFLNYDVPLFMGEFSFFNNPDSWRYSLNLYNKKGYGWAMWTYKIIGHGGNSWGLYTCDPPKIDVETAGYDEILAAFSSLSTDSFEANRWLIDIVSKYAVQ
ncbi:MAG: glycoside hydrolase family 5 protein [Clostridiales bacterium]|jgi:hypothetical protein|nr:glycoside hydrolase family 5 protein [Clostridiales bacterium]